MPEAEKPSLPETVVRAGLSAVPVVGGALAELFSYALELDRSRVRQMGESARETVGDDDRMIRRLEEEERLLDMLVEAADAARRTSWEAKRKIMGRVLGQAMSDDADIDDYASLLSALISLDAAHFHILGRVAATVPQPPLAGHVIEEPYRSNLVAQGVLTLAGTFDGRQEVVGISSFGSRLLAWVAAEERDEDAR